MSITFKIVGKLMHLIVAVYHKEAQRLHSVAAETDQSITDAETRAAEALTEANKLRDDLLIHKTAAATASDRATNLESLLTK